MRENLNQIFLSKKREISIGERRERRISERAIFLKEKREFVMRGILLLLYLP